MVTKTSTKAKKVNVYQNPRPTLNRFTEKQVKNTNCSVILTDLQADIANRITKLENELLELKSKYAAFDSYCEQAEVLSTIVNPNTCSSPRALQNAAQFLHSLSTEVMERLKRSKHALVLNIPDKLDTKRVITTLLRNCGLESANFTALRLRKRLQKNQCPILVKFNDESIAQMFIQSQNLLRIKSPYGKIVICQDKTPLQRQQIASVPTPPKSPTTYPNTMRIEDTTPEDAHLAISDTKRANSPTSPACISTLTQKSNEIAYDSNPEDESLSPDNGKQFSALSTTPTSHPVQEISNNSFAQAGHSNDVNTTKRLNVNLGSLLSGNEQHVVSANDAHSQQPHMSSSYTHSLHDSQKKTGNLKSFPKKTENPATQRNSTSPINQSKPRFARQNQSKPQPMQSSNRFSSPHPHSLIGSTPATNAVMSTPQMCYVHPNIIRYNSWHPLNTNLYPTSFAQDPFFTILPYMNTPFRIPYHSSLQEMQLPNQFQFSTPYLLPHHPTQ